jgi:uncharacterized protein YwqG
MELKDLEPFLEKIVKIDRTKEAPANAKESYIGGYPFVPNNGQNWEWPRTKDGNPLVFIVQINFKEVPKGFGYPEAGLFQVFVDLDDYDGTRETLCVVVYTEEELSSESVSQPSDIGPTIDEDANPFWVEYSPRKITFKEGLQIPSDLLSFAESRHEHPELIPDFKEKVKNLHEVLLSSGGELPKDFDFLVENHHQLGGEPYWVQGDMLDIDQNPTFMLQIDSDYLDDDFLMFGDAGNLHIFGDLERLKEGDVSEFYWEWACY